MKASFEECAIHANANYGPEDIPSAKNTDPRTCTCHPDDRPPIPCARKYALHDCRVSELLHALDAVIRFDNEPDRPNADMTSARLSFREVRRIRHAAEALARWR